MSEQMTLSALEQLRSSVINYQREILSDRELASQLGNALSNGMGGDVISTKVVEKLSPILQEFEVLDEVTTRLIKCIDDDITNLELIISQTEQL